MVNFLKFVYESCQMDNYHGSTYLAHLISFGVMFGVPLMSHLFWIIFIILCSLKITLEKNWVYLIKDCMQVLNMFANLLMK